MVFTPRCSAECGPYATLQYVVRPSVRPAVCLWHSGMFFTQVGYFKNNFTAD